MDITISNNTNSLINIKKYMEAEKPKTDLQFILVLDFEATCIQDQKIEPCPEIIQFPVIVAHLPTGKQLDVFHQYVTPSFNPNLSKFCTELTGITQEMVNKGIPLEQTLKEFDWWISKLGYLKQDNFAFVTCGDWDLRTCLRQEAKHKRLYIKNYLRKYINIKKYFAKVISKDGSHGMMPMLNKLGLKHEGRHHSGIDDVKNITNICIQIAKNHGATFPKEQINIVKFNLPAQDKKPDFRYLLTLSFESTCLQKGKMEPCAEIIQFTVGIVDSHEATELDLFHEYVRPKFNPKLTEFCQKYTGISQQKIDNAKYLDDVLEQFDKWLFSHQYLEKDNFAFVIYGDWDIGSCLRPEVKQKKLKVPQYFEKYFNLKAYFPKLVQIKGKVRQMAHMMDILEIKSHSKEHSSITDTKNMNQICFKLLKKHDAKFPKNEIRTITF